MKHSTVGFFVKPPSKHEQKGVVLFVALIVLVLMSMAGLAMMQQISAGVSIAGNLAFKQNATSGAERGTTDAISFLIAQNTAVALKSDIPASGYFSTWATTFDPASYDWEGSNKSKLATSDDGTGNEIRYVIHRLCKVPDLVPTDPGQQCSMKENQLGVPKEELGNTLPPEPSYTPFFRITNRVKGARNTVSYTQVISEYSESK